jgi:hypothetical protein
MPQTARDTRTAISRMDLCSMEGAHLRRLTQHANQLRWPATGETFRNMLLHDDRWLVAGMVKRPTSPADDSILDPGAENSVAERSSVGNNGSQCPRPGRPVWP